MKRGLWFLSLLLLFAPVSVNATDTRIQSLGGKEKALTVFDETSALLLPATLLLFPNVVYLDVGIDPALTSGDAVGSAGIGYETGFSVFYQLGENTVIGLYGSSLRRELSGNLMDRAFRKKGKWAGINVDTKDDAENGERGIHNADHKGTLLVAHRVKRARFGASVGLWSDHYEQSVPVTEKFERGGTLVDAALGFGVDLPHNNNIDFALRGWWGDITDDLGESTRFESTKSRGIELVGRGYFDVFGGERAVPYIRVDYFSSGIAWNQQNNRVTDDYSLFALLVGLDLRVEPLENVFIYPGIGMAVVGETISESLAGDTLTIKDDSSKAPYFSGAVDARVASWLALRFAARQTIKYFTYKTEENKGRDDDVVTEYMLGAGIIAGRFQIDLMLNPELFLKGPVVVSGKEWTDEFAFQSAVRFAW